MRDFYFSEWLCYESDEIAAVTRVLESGKVNYWTGEEGGRRRTEGRGRRAEDGGQRAEDGEQRVEDRGRRAEDGGRRVED